MQLHHINSLPSQQTGIISFSGLLEYTLQARPTKTCVLTLIYVLIVTEI